MAIPAQGMIEFRDALTDLLDEFGTEDDGSSAGRPGQAATASGAAALAPLPEGRHVKVDNKNFYFDIGQNNRGVYMRISEVSLTLYYHHLISVDQALSFKARKIQKLKKILLKTQ